MNSHDTGLLYASLTPEQRQRLTLRQIHLADVRDAMEQGFKPEPDVALHHLPPLSDEALARFFTESEKWRDKARERDLERRIQTLIDADEKLNGHYLKIREIIGALDTPKSFYNHERNQPGHIAYTEHKARELVEKADDSERNRRAATEAGQRVDLLDRYVKACDEKSLPYNWNVFKMPTKTLRETVYSHESMEPCTNCDVNHEKVKLFETRQKQELEQSLRYFSQRSSETKTLIEKFMCDGKIDTLMAGMIVNSLEGRSDSAQCGDQVDPNPWIVWEWGYGPKDINRDAMIEIETHDGGTNTLRAQVIEWSDVKRYRLAK